MASDMDLPPQESNGNTQPYDDNRNVRTLEPVDEMRTFEGNFENVNLKGPCPPIDSNPSTLQNEANRQHLMFPQEAPGIKKKLQGSQVQVVEDMDDDSETFCPIRPKMTTKQGIVQPQQEFRTFNCQTSSVNTNKIQSQLDGNNCFRKFKYRPGHVLPGTQQSLLHLLDVYSRYPTKLAIGCHGILTTANNRPTEHGEYEEGVQSSKGYQFVKDVGTGSFGCVKLYRDNTTHVLFVKKQILNKDADFLDEVKFLSELSHGNIVQLYGFILRDNIPEILMEYAGVSLEKYTTSCEDKIIEITYQGLSGLEYLDSKGIIHYDIKPQNLCVLEKGSNITLKITDFGSAKRETEPPNFMGFTMEYLSPELGIQLMLSKYQSSIPKWQSFDTTDYVMMTKSDIFSFALSIMFVYKKGHVVISLVNNGKMSYNGLDEASIIRLRETILVSLTKNLSLVRTVLIPDVCSSCCHGMRRILTAMVEEVPHKRPTAYEIKYYMDVFWNRKKIPVFLSYDSFIAKKRVNLTRRLSYKSSATQDSSNRGPVRSNVSNSRGSRDQRALPYGYTGHQKMVNELTKNPSLVRTVACSEMRSMQRDMVEVPPRRPMALEINDNMDVLLNRIPSNSSLTADIQDQSSLPSGYTGHEKMDTSD